MKNCNIPRLVVMLLGVGQCMSLLIVGGAIWLGREVPVAFWVLAANPTTALGAILSTTRPQTPSVSADSAQTQIVEISGDGGEQK